MRAPCDGATQRRRAALQACSAIAKRAFNADTDSIRGIGGLGMHVLPLPDDLRRAANELFPALAQVTKTR